LCRGEVVAPCTDRCRLALFGEVDLASAGRLRAFLDDHVGHVPPGGELVLDMSGVEFFAAEGMRVLFEAATRARGRGAALRLHPVPKWIARVLEIGRIWPEVERGPGGSEVVAAPVAHLPA
jgi:anti-anti-sigma factor